MRVLRARLLEMKQAEKEEEVANLRGEYTKAEWGSQIRSYVLHPYQMVKDHRTDYERGNTQAVLDGDLDDFMEEYLKQIANCFGHQLLMVSLAYRKRAIPIAWTWIKYVRGHSTGSKQIALLAYVKTLIPRGAAVFLVGDTEFGAVKVLKQLDKWHWYYVLRQKSDTLVWSQTENQWVPFGSYVQKAGQSVWLGKRELSQTHIYPANLLVHWKSGEKEPWCLATNLPDLQTALRFYKRRMWIEEMFGDMKKHGFDLECSMLHSFLRLSRLTLAVAFLYVWLVSSGGRTIHQGLRHLVDRKDRRDLSIFQIGLRFTERCLVNAFSIRVSLCAYF